MVDTLPDLTLPSLAVLLHLETDIRLNPTSQPVHTCYGNERSDNKGGAARGCLSNGWTVYIKGPVFTKEI